MYYKLYITYYIYIKYDYIFININYNYINNLYAHNYHAIVLGKIKGAMNWLLRDTLHCLESPQTFFIQVVSFQIFQISTNKAKF